MHKKLMGFMLFVLGGLVVILFQQVGQTAPSLTALDYAEIHQLYARYAFAADTTADDGGMYARVFTEDGIFDVTNALPTGRTFPIQGHEALKEFQASLAGTPAPYHYTTNILIEPSSTGASGTAYVLIVGNDPDGQHPTIKKGVYQDQLVKTSAGWRLKKRTWTWHRFSGDSLEELAQ